MTAVLALAVLAGSVRAQQPAFAVLAAAAEGSSVFDARRAPPVDPNDPEAPPALLDAPFTVPVPEPARLPAARRMKAGPRTMGYDALIRENARRNGLDERFVKAVIAGESEFSKSATSRAGARGLMQLMPATAAELGVSADALYRPAANIRAGTDYLAKLFAAAWRRYHLRGVAYSRAPGWLLQRILAAYNAGPRFLQRRKLYRQTRLYVAKVLSLYRSSLTELVPPRRRSWVG